MSKRSRIGITSWGSFSPLGSEPSAIWKAYQNTNTSISQLKGKQYLGAALSNAQEAHLDTLSHQDKNYKHLDKSVLMTMAAAELSLNTSQDKRKNIAVNIGSSRGATALFESHHAQHLNLGASHLHPLTSPTTTSGNISSWVAYHMNLEGFSFSHSVTCSTALHAILNGVAWLKAGLCHQFLAGGSEAPLTDFTLAQMKALRIYSNRNSEEYPCLALDVKKDQNTMVLGEGSACFLLKINPLKSIVHIDGIGYGQENIKHATAISKDGKGFQKAMRMALSQSDSSTVDAIICHAPGTQKGDLAELQAIKRLFGKNIPLLTSNKWKIGHTLGASGALSLEFALLMLIHNQFISIPYLEQKPYNQGSLKRIMVNAAGFGGNVVSIIVSRD